ncbi:MAG: AraC family transcriptional regulator [Verrucomicrobiota bacterium]|nr:AraC family transcriptional regulator [Verrucomicrobiota bacterium]
MTQFWEKQWKAGAKLIIATQYGLVRCEQNWCWDIEAFTDYDIWTVLDGEGEMTIDGVSHPIGAGFTVCFTPGPHSVHARHDPARPLKVFYCHFQLQQPAGFPDPKPPLTAPLMVNSDELRWSTLQELTACLDTRRDPALRENLLWQLLLRSERPSPLSSTSPWERVRVIVRQILEVPGATHTVDKLARQAGLSAGHFTRVFRAMTGESPIQHILNRRIERACYYLRETHLPIQQIASATGYSDVYFFSRQFKERMGISPSRYRAGAVPSPLP